MKNLLIALLALPVVACSGADAPADAAPEAPATDAAAEATDAAATDAAPEADAKADAHGDHGGDHSAHGGEAHHGADGKELTGFEKMRAAANPREVDGWTLFGEDFTLTEAQPLSSVLASADETGEAKVRVEGTVADVCTKMGCWMVVQQGEDSIRVTVKEHGFGVDRDCAGKTASLEGVLRSKDVDPKLAEHYASESRKPEAMPETGKDKVWELVATSVAIKPAA